MSYGQMNKDEEILLVFFLRLVFTHTSIFKTSNKVLTAKKSLGATEGSKYEMT